MLKPITGTWFEFQHHNIPEGKYWNPICRWFSDEQWEAKVDEIAELGMKYIVLLTTAQVYDDTAFAYFKTDINDWYVESGEYEIMAARSSRDIACTATVQIESTTVIKKVFTLNSTVEELMSTPAGAQMFSQMMAKMMPKPPMDHPPVEGEMPAEPPMGAGMPPEPPAGDGMGMGAAMAAMMGGMPLRSLVAFSGGAFPLEAARAIVAQLNA